jgi:hypothetical protein
LRRPRRRTQPVSHQHVECALGNRDAADRLDLGARDGLVIGDDRKRLDRGARELLRLLRFARHQVAEIVRGAERPLAGDADEIHAAACVCVLQHGEQRRHVHAFGQARGKRLLVERLGGREQERFEHAQRVLDLACRRDDVLLLRRRVFVFRGGVREFQFLSPKGSHVFFSRLIGTSFFPAAQPDRCERGLLLQFDLAFLHHFQRRAEA